MHFRSGQVSGKKYTNWSVRFPLFLAAMSAEMFLRNSRLSVPERFPEKSLTAKPKGIVSIH